MHLLVVDPRLLVRAFEHPHSQPAKLLGLLMYGQVCLDAWGQPLDEAADLEDKYRYVAKQQHLAEARARAQRAQEAAERRQRLMEDVFEQHPPGDLLLVTSVPLKAEFVELARESQGRGNRHVRPDVVVRQLARWSAKFIFDLPPAPFYLGAGRVSDREYLIHTAIEGSAQSLVTEDEVLLLPGDLSHSDPKTRRTVRPYSLADFVSDELHHAFDFDAINAAAVFRAAVRPLGRVS